MQKHSRERERERERAPTLFSEHIRCTANGHSFARVRYCYGYRPIQSLVSEPDSQSKGEGVWESGTETIQHNLSVPETIQHNLSVPETIQHNLSVPVYLLQALILLAITVLHKLYVCKCKKDRSEAPSLPTSEL